MAVPQMTGRKTWVTASVAAALFASVGLGSLPASAAPGDDGSVTPAKPAPVSSVKARITDTSKFGGALKTSVSGRHSVFVQFAGTGAADASAAVVSKGKATQKATAKATREAHKRTSSSVVAAATTKDAAVETLFVTTNSVPGVAINADAAALTALAARSDVVKITPLVPKKVDNSSAAQLTKVLNAWQSLGVTGKGIRVGVIDTGIDYTHADFGGPGTVAAYDAAHANEAGPFTPTAKVVGGYDFVGDSYRPTRLDLATSRFRIRTPTRWTATDTAAT